MKKIALLFMVLCCAGIIQAQFTAKNIIYIIGDGMGTAHVYASIVQQKGKSNFMRFPVVGFSITSSLNAYTTDSGAGGTALLTGHKVQNYHIAQSPEGKPYPSILVHAKQKGKSVGFVVTSSVTDATPASTYAHVANRKSKDSISLQMSRCGFDVMIGGEYNCFLPKYRKDGLNPLDTLRRCGYHVSRTVKDMRSHKEGKLCALLTDEAPDLAPKRDTFLAEGTRKAIELLRKDTNGFVLMVEGSHIDKSCHANNDTALMAELLEFEAMLGVVLDFAKEDGNTLVVVTADHETGGLALPNGNLEKGESICKFNLDNHTGVMVPVFAYGPQSKPFAGIHENVDIYTLVKSALDRTGRMTPLLRGRGNSMHGRVKSAPSQLGGESGQPMLTPTEKPSRIQAPSGKTARMQTPSGKPSRIQTLPSKK